MATGGWNRPQSGAEVKPQKKPTVLRGIIAGGAVVLAAVVVAVFVFSGDDAELTAKEKKSGRIKEVTPAKAAKAEEPKPEPPKKVDPNARPTKVGEIVNNYEMLPSGRIHHIRGIVTNDMNSCGGKAPYEIFEDHCDNEIACLITLRPGENIVGTPDYGGFFKAEFIESLKHPIIVSEDDSEYAKQLKRDVIQVKADMKAALDRGEDIEQMMLDARKQSQDLFLYKRQLEEMTEEFVENQAQTEEEIDDYIKALDTMLEKKGIAASELGPISKKRFRRMLKKLGGTQ